MSDLAKAVKLFCQPGDVTELRIMDCDGHMSSGFFDERRTLAIVAQDMTSYPETKAVYWTLNRIRRSTIKYIKNSLDIRPRFATRGGNIECRDWLLIDVDPKRESGTNATDAEKLEAKKVVDKVLAFLTSIGWPEPVFVDSGNGYHLLYKIHLDSDTGCHVKEVLRVLGWKFDTPFANVDQSVFDANRICKVPGTWSRKGPNSPERPWRLSRLISAPEAPKLVNFEQIFAMRMHAPKAPPKPETPGMKFTTNRMEEFFATFEDEIAVSYSARKGGSTFHYLAECPFNEGEHRDQNTKTAIITDSKGTRFHCFSDDCADYRFADLIALMEERTGIHFELESDEECEAAWGGIEHETPDSEHITRTVELANSQSRRT